MSSPAVIRYKDAAGIAWLTIDNSDKLNAMTYEMWVSLPALVARAVKDPEIRFIALQGGGEKAFCSGADISQFGTQRTGADATSLYEQAVDAGIAALVDSAKPTVAIIRGVCFGGGCAMALACDLRIATSDSTFRIPAARLGLGYAYDLVAMMINKLGMTAATEILMTAHTLDTAEASRLGLAHRMWPRGIFESEAGSYLAAVVGNAPLTLQAIKRTLNELGKPEGQRDRAKAEALIAACFKSADYREGQAAFLEKRDPLFRGR